MLHSFKLRQSLKEGIPLLGVLLTLDSPEIAEIISSSGYDWIFMDLEHSPMNALSAQRLLQSIGSDCPTVIRVPNHQEEWIKKTLDIGASGLLFPRVNTAEEARNIIGHCKYSPLGSRSVGLARAHSYGKEFQSYVANANDDIAIVMQIEDIKGVQNIEEIVNVPGIDALFIGPYDLSASMGKPGLVNDPEVQQQIGKVRDICLDTDIALGIFTTNPDDVNTFIEQGYTLIAVGIDTGIIANSFKNILERIQK